MIVNMKIVCCCTVPMFRSLFPPLYDGSIIRGFRRVVEVIITQIPHSMTVSCFRCFLPPSDSLLEILCDSFPIVIHTSEFPLCRSVPLFRCFAEPFRCCFIISKSLFSIRIFPSEQKLRFGIILFGLFFQVLHIDGFSMFLRLNWQFAGIGFSQLLLRPCISFFSAKFQYFELSIHQFYTHFALP